MEGGDATTVGQRETPSVTSRGLLQRALCSWNSWLGLSGCGPAREAGDFSKDPSATKAGPAPRCVHVGLPAALASSAMWVVLPASPQTFPPALHTNPLTSPQPSCWWVFSCLRPGQGAALLFLGFETAREAGNPGLKGKPVCSCECM